MATENDLRDARLVRHLLGREKQGDCPDVEALERFRRNDLPAVEMDAVRKHIATCGLCDLLVSRAASFGDGADLSGIDWGEVEPRLRQRIFGGRDQNRVRRLVLHPAFAYATALVIAIPAIWVLVTSGKPEPHPIPVPASMNAAIQPLAIVSLNRTRGGMAEVSLAQSGERFALSFFVPVEPGRRYQATLVNTAGGPTASIGELTRPDSMGNFLVLCEKGRFQPGEYTLTVAETDLNGAATGRSFAYHLRLAERAR